MRELKSLTYFLTDPLCLSLFKKFLTIQAMLQARNCSFNSCFSTTHISISGLVASSSLVHQSLASSAIYILVIETFSSLGTRATLKYHCMSYIKFSRSLALRVLLKGLGLEIFILTAPSSHKGLCKTVFMSLMSNNNSSIRY